MAGIGTVRRGFGRTGMIGFVLGGAILSGISTASAQKASDASGLLADGDRRLEGAHQPMRQWLLRRPRECLRARSRREES